LSIFIYLSSLTCPKLGEREKRERVRKMRPNRIERGRRAGSSSVHVMTRKTAGANAGGAGGFEGEGDTDKCKSE
jgi:hypothetical protein